MSLMAHGYKFNKNPDIPFMAQGYFAGAGPRLIMMKNKALTARAKG